jgi:hypothetical protein
LEQLRLLFRRQADAVISDRNFGISRSAFGIGASLPQPGLSPYMNNEKVLR